MTESSLRRNSPNVDDSIIPNGKSHILDEIVIAGFSGRLPESSNIEEFKQQLFDGIDLVSDDERRWPSDLYGIPSKGGKLKDLTKFDASFFGIHAKQADVMDPQMRLLLEATYEAIVDAGINPSELRGSKTGVYVAITHVEANSYWLKNPDHLDGYRVFGTMRSLMPNRISYIFDLKGPSSAIHSACSSSFTAFNQAVDDIRFGNCDAAIVGGVNLTMDPMISLQYWKLNMLSPDGRCKSFDAEGIGYVRSEAVVAMFLQKSRDAKRVYATVVHSKTNTDGYKPLITYPSRQMQAKLMRELYSEAGVDPAEVPLVEAHGSGTEAGDSEEVNAIADVFCQNRKEPLLLGAVKSNMGHPEPVSGLCAIIKVLLAMETGVIPGNLHFKTPNPNVPALNDGRIKVVDRSMPWNGGFTGVNSFGVAGTNVHILLRSNQKCKVNLSTHTEVPKIVAVSGRTEEAVKTFLNKIQDHEDDDEFISMVQDLHASRIKGHEYRGFQILGNAGMREVEEVSEEKRPLWYVFGGNGSQWSGMGQGILSIDSVHKSLERCASAVKSKGIDLINIIQNGTNETLENVVNSYVCITSIQVALVDLLSLIGIQPDGLIGHSIGELGCAYADGTLTAEETVLVAYWRAQLILESNLIKGAMAFIGLSWEETEKRCPADIYLACHNSLHSVTVSGPSESVAKFIEQLKKEGIFSQEVQSCDAAFHSKYIASVGPKFRVVLEKIISLKERSPRWISSSIPESQWETPLAQFSSPAYFVNNLLSPVLFHEALTHVPDNAIVIEIGPHSLFQAVLRRSLPPTVTKIGLQNRNNSDNLSFLLENIGKLYINGGEPKLSKLYPGVTYPVGRGTPMINSMVRWDHSVQWSIPDFSKVSRHSGQNRLEVDLSTEKDAYITDHCINDRIIFPVAAYLLIVWKTFAGLREKDFEKMPVVFENLLFHRPIIMTKDSSANFLVNILEGSGNFEITENGSPAVTGKIRSSENMEMEESNLPVPVGQNEPDLLTLTKSDVYKDLRIRGHDYRGIFQTIESSDNQGLCGKLSWLYPRIEKWISFLDSMIQFTILGKNNRKALLPTRLEYAAINPVLHKQMLERSQNKDMPVYNYTEIGIVKAGGVVLRGMKFSLFQKSLKTQADSKLEKYVFVPFESTQSLAKDEENAKLHALSVLLQVARENIGGYKLKVIEAIGEFNADALLAPLALDILRSEPMLSVDFKLVTSSAKIYSSFIEAHNVQVVVGNMQKLTLGQDLHLILTRKILKGEMKGILKNLEASLKPGGFILSEEPAKIDSTSLSGFKLQIVGQQILPDKSYVLLRKEEEVAEKIVIQITGNNFSWLEELKAAMRTSEKEGQKILVFSQGEDIGLVGFMNCLRLEPGGLNTCYFFIQDKNVPKFSLSDAFYVGQMMKQLSANVLKGGKWGSYRHLRISDTSDKPSFEAEHAYLDTLVEGDWNSLGWIASPLQYDHPDKSDQELCHVYYAGLYLRDTISTGKLNLPYDVASQDDLTKYGVGLEFAGRDSIGRRVMGMVPTGGIATTLLPDLVFIWEVPETWRMEEAATIPIAYAMSYYALFVIGQLCKKKSLLIHDGSGKVGQTSIAIALHTGCSVLTTVDSEEQRDILKGIFPQLKERNIINRQKANFEQLVLYETRGKGVDLVLNSLPEEHFMSSTSCLAKKGRFLEIGKYNSSDDINLDGIFNSDCSTKKEIVRLISDGIKNGVVVPLPALIFTAQKVKEAFKHMTSRNYVNKVLIKIREEEFQKITKPAMKTITAIRRTYFNPRNSYILVGGLGGFGLELTNWMITRGAKYIILTSRSRIRSGYQAFCFRRWRETGAMIQVSTRSVATKDGAESLLKEAVKLGPVGGIFIQAADPHEVLIEDLNEGHFKTVTLPKINATKNLDSASREYCPTLEYFVCFSSSASGRGNSGQTNDALANSTMERIMEERRALGLPGLAIQWRPIGDVEIVAESMNSSVKALNGKYTQQISSCLKTLDFFLQLQYPVLSSMVIAKIEKSHDTLNQMSVTDFVAKILEIKDLKKVNMSKSLPELGMDSMMGIEIKTTFEKKFDLFLSLPEVRALTFGKLLELSK